jgi:protein-disulfide isomerase
MDNSPSSLTPSTPQSFGVPAAIIIAGGLIALAIYFGGGRTPLTTPAPTNVAANPTQPPQPTIGAFRAVSDADHTRGPANARVTIIEYSDLECPFCKRFHPTMLQLLKDYPNDVRWVYRHFPIPQLHKQATAESVAVECADDQGKFWELLDKIYEVTPSNDGLDLATLPQLARQVGVANIPQFETCLKSTTHDERIAQDVTDAGVAGGRGTPYSVIIGPSGTKTPVNGALPYEQVKAMVDAALKS